MQSGLWKIWIACSFCICHQVADLIKECRQALADSLFSWTCQSPLSKDDTLALIGHLETVTAQADGSLDSVSLALVMALLYCLDVSFIEQGTEDRDGKFVLMVLVFFLFFLLKSLIPKIICLRVFSSRFAPGTSIADRKAVCVCSAQSPDGQPTMEASGAAGRVSTGVGSVAESPFPAATGLR